MKNLFILLFFSVMPGKALLASNQYPLEFADFFEERRETVEVIIAGEGLSQKITADVSYESFRLNGEVDNAIFLLSRYLDERKVTASAIEKIIKQLSSGIKANPGCEGILPRCVPESIPGEAGYVYDFDNKLLKIFISPEMLDSSGTSKEYYSSLRTNNALINWSDLYAYFGDDGDAQFNWRNNTLLGLPAGVLSLDTQYYDSKNELNVYRALYDVEIGAHRGWIGYQDRDSESLNTTDFLSFGANYSGLGLSLGSSSNLLKGNKQAQQRIYFYAAQTAQLEVYKGERLLLSRVVPAGQQSIGYDELPPGVYTLRLVLKQGSSEIFNDLRQVVNTKQFSLALNDWDYRIDSGYLKNINYSDDKLDEISNAERIYARGAFSYRPIEVLLGAGSFTQGGDDSLIQLGGFWMLDDKFNMQYTAGLFTSGDSYQYGKLTYSSFSASVRHVKANEYSSALVRLLYGDVDTKEIGVGFFGNFFGGTSYLSYFNYQTDDGNSNDKSDNISLTWSRDLFGGQFSFNTTYNHYGRTKDTLNSSLTWSYNFGNSLTGRIGIYADNDGFSNNLNNLTYQYSGDDYLASTTAGIKLGREGNDESEWSGSVSGHNRYLQHSTNAYVNSNGQRSLSTTLSGSQILSSDGGALTYQKGSAFVAIEPEFTEPSKQKEIKLKYDIIRDGQYWYRDSVSALQGQMIDLSPYTEVAFELNAEADNVDIENNNYRHFVHPGTYYQLDSKVTPLESQTFILNDMFGKPIPAVRCIGEGCKSVEPLSDDGVYRVNFRKNSPFKLISEKRLCVYDSDLMGEQYIYAYCLPGLDDINDQIVWSDIPNLIKDNDVERALLYIGKYESTEQAKHFLTLLKEVGLESKAIEVANAQYVYVRYLEQYTTAQRSLLESLDAYVILDTISIDQLFSVR
ncbi:TcfC E-set like domain-containing protein [Photobacterium angustum]|uniref:Pilus assembly protein E-set like domain-containing protein n=1 Tax=Photobacterium angustum TaxID=661 RepID=A0A855SB30_PHOAN|nr:TcfC E-set like domain-containing protein [Photobacterium angustum]PSV87945.1 hypothetical protein CTN01_21200 [Photobacterium angustum]PSW96915.1 hypothetical protein C0W79_01305 [Photobacterium angustum]PSX00548.1 hypothetical protein C0W87_17395 [Photobacterium angustum]PSX05463.1 hypothetical protein C0W41_17640 [Photobacterium angustum]PSX14230.1 hypothetical protein C0W55_14680 [Photobacterium angustum]